MVGYRARRGRARRQERCLARQNHSTLYPVPYEHADDASKPDPKTTPCPLQAELANLYRSFHVKRLEVFRSAARGDDFAPERSDVDFLVEFAPDSPLSPLNAWFGLEQQLSAVLGRKVERVSPCAVRNPYVRAGIDRSRELVYGT